MIIYNKLDNYFVVSADRQTFLGFEMTVNLRDTSPLRKVPIKTKIFLYGFLLCEQILAVLGGIQKENER